MSGTTSKKELDDLAWLIENPRYEHRPVDIRTFIDDPDYLNAGAECWPSIKDDLEELFSGNHTEAVFCFGIGGGKSYASSVIVSYQVYLVLCLKNPQEFLGLAKDSRICFINMSVTAEQSKRVVFTEIKSRIDNSPWFQNYYPPDPNIKSELRFPKGVIVFPGNSRETFPLGLNLLGGILDEAAWFIDTPNHDVAEEIFNAIHNRRKNRFGDKGLLVIISSPRYEDDFIERKIAEAKTNNKIFAKRKMLWQSKPLSYFSGEWIDFDGYKIPKEFETEAKRNPDKFKRDYMAIPSLTLEPFFKRWDLVEMCINKGLEHPIDELGRFKPWFVPGRRRRADHYIHVDLALRQDAAGFAMVHNEGDVVVCDLMLQIKAPVGGEIKFSEIRDLIYALDGNGFYITKITYDGWQSIDSIQILRDKGFYCEVLSVDRDLAAYQTFKEKIYTGKYKFYYYEPFLRELRRLELVEGRRVDHPPNKGSKDVTDAVAGAVYSAVKGQSRVVQAKII